MAELEATDVRAWQDAASTAFVPLLCTSLAPGFTAHLESVPLSGGVSLARIMSGPLRVERTVQLARQSGDDDLLLSLQLKSTGDVHQHGRTARLVPGAAALYETNRPYLLDQPRAGQDLIVLRVPRRRLGLKDALVSDLCGRTMDGSVPGMAAFNGYVFGIIAGRSQLTAQARQELGQISADLLALALRSFAGLRGTGWDNDQTLLQSAKAYIRRHLGDPNLGVERLARALNVSQRKLHSLFSSTGETPAAYARRLRMEHAASLLAARPQTNQAIHAIATACGFRDTSTFTRTFRQAYQCSPTQWLLLADQGDEQTL
ncbi:AraC family transcriptional regulator [Paeniglutamicibacter antarcticus]|uniref:AraC family transcriptional regulator n=1 Tax=Arthrobacter terrae TaxID=2935737 RepID=A0A931G6W5_9MICC|nr:AraC family transcriptional regulator [Arthrobacter terrae]MBG0741100.1 AraC family transcriptional regulator [Arthrobacter terrae]